MSNTKKLYSELEKDLSDIIGRIEHASYDDLEDLLKDHEQGMKIVSELQKRLASAMSTIKKVS